MCASCIHTHTVSSRCLSMDVWRRLPFVSTDLSAEPAPFLSTSRPEPTDLGPFVSGCPQLWWLPSSQSHSQARVTVTPGL